MTVTILALADSSSNFTAIKTSAAAIFNSSTGSFGGATLSNGTNLTSFTTSIKTKTPNGQSTATNAGCPSGDVCGTTGACMACMHAPAKTLSFYLNV
jgi:hypothetical protein